MTSSWWWNVAGYLRQVSGVEDNRASRYFHHGKLLHIFIQLGFRCFIWYVRIHNTSSRELNKISDIFQTRFAMIYRMEIFVFCETHFVPRDPIGNKSVPFQLMVRCQKSENPFPKSILAMFYDFMWQKRFNIEHSASSIPMGSYTYICRICKYMYIMHTFMVDVTIWLQNKTMNNRYSKICKENTGNSVIFDSRVYAGSHKQIFVFFTSA